VIGCSFSAFFCNAAGQPRAAGEIAAEHLDDRSGSNILQVDDVGGVIPDDHQREIANHLRRRHLTMSPRAC
jgi:hypothetical protein